MKIYLLLSRLHQRLLKDTQLNQAGYDSANKSFPYEVRLPVNIKFHEL